MWRPPCVPAWTPCGPAGEQGGGAWSKQQGASSKNTWRILPSCASHCSQCAVQSRTCRHVSSSCSSLAHGLSCTHPAGATRARSRSCPRRWMRRPRASASWAPLPLPWPRWETRLGLPSWRRCVLSWKMVLGVVLLGVGALGLLVMPSAILAQAHVVVVRTSSSLLCSAAVKCLLRQAGAVAVFVPVAGLFQTRGNPAPAAVGGSAHHPMERRRRDGRLCRCASAWRIVVAASALPHSDHLQLLVCSARSAAWLGMPALSCGD